MKYYNLTPIVIILSLFLLGSNVNAQSGDPAKQLFNVDTEGLALDGYDPVAYILQQKAVKGNKSYSHRTAKAIYYFSTSKNRDLFKQDPVKYEPAYGGWCAYAMGYSGEKVEVDPETFKIIGGKVYLYYNFYFTNTLKEWNKDEKNLKAKADVNWKEINSRSVSK